tara:strand:+ start:1267 stop:1440 length:174 start_codon:yes stop_codon:yes gene_type:complete
MYAEERWYWMREWNGYILLLAFLLLHLSASSLITAQSPGGCNWPLLKEGLSGEDVTR